MDKFKEWVEKQKTKGLGKGEVKKILIQLDYVPEALDAVDEIYAFKLEHILHSRNLWVGIGIFILALTGAVYLNLNDEPQTVLIEDNIFDLTTEPKSVEEGPLTSEQIEEIQNEIGFPEGYLEYALRNQTI